MPRGDTQHCGPSFWTFPLEQQRAGPPAPSSSRAHRRSGRGGEVRPDGAQKLAISLHSRLSSLERDFLHPDIHVVPASRKTKKTNCC